MSTFPSIHQADLIRVKPAIRADCAKCKELGHACTHEISLVRINIASANARADADLQRSMAHGI